MDQQQTRLAVNAHEFLNGSLVRRANQKPCLTEPKLFPKALMLKTDACALKEVLFL